MAKKNPLDFFPPSSLAFFSSPSFLPSLSEHFLSPRNVPAPVLSKRRGHPSTRLFLRYLLSICCVSGSGLGAGETVVNKMAGRAVWLENGGARVRGSRGQITWASYATGGSLGFI